MSVDKVKGEIKANVDIGWEELIEHSGREICACETRIKELRKSLKYFKIQLDKGVPFPTKKTIRHCDLS